MKLNRTEVQKLIDEVLLKMPHDDCRTCDCFLGFIAQLELDSQEDVSGITNPLKALREEIHGCLGCNPCPPAEVHSNYIRRKLIMK